MSDLWFSTEKKGFNQLGDFIHLEHDWNSSNVVIEFSAMKAIKLDNGSICLGMIATKITGVANNVKIEFPFACAVTIHTEPYQIYDAKAKGKVEVKNGDLEAVLLKYFGDDFNFEKCYKGSIELVYTKFVSAVIEGKMTHEQLALVTLEETEDLPIKDLRLESSKNGSKGGKSYAPAETTAQRIEARTKALFALADDLLTDKVKEAPTLYQVTLAVVALDPESRETWLSLFDSLIK